MGKRFSLVITLLACAGAAVATVLTYSQYFPSVIEGLVICSGKYAGNCNALHQWRFAVIFGIPLAGYGLFMYLLIIASDLSAFFSSGRLHGAAFALVATLVAASLIADVMLAGVMVWLKTICMLCVTTYVLNGLMLLVVFFWYLRLRKEHGFSLRVAFRQLLPQSADSPGKRKATVLCGLLVVLLLGGIFAMSQFFQNRAVIARHAHAKQFVENFYRQKADVPALPESSLVIGSPQARVRFIVFTDFLCSACYQFYLFEKDLPARYGDQVSVTYYNYARNESSKLAAKAVLAAAQANVLPQYLDRHFARYQEFRSKYTRDGALAVATGLTDPARFGQEMTAASLDDVLKRDFDLAKGINIVGTPTLFINGRRIDGVPSDEILDMIVARELTAVSTHK